MASPLEKPTSINTKLDGKQEVEHQLPHQEVEEGEDYEEQFLAGGGCWFRWLCFCRDRSGDTYRRSLLHSVNEECCFLKKAKKLREASEIVAGPRWKNFIRRFNNNNKAKRKKGQFQYDPLSYALNFDGGEEDDRYSCPSFSARFEAGMSGGLGQKPAAFPLNNGS